MTPASAQVRISESRSAESTKMTTLTPASMSRHTWRRVALSPVPMLSRMPSGLPLSVALNSGGRSHAQSTSRPLRTNWAVRHSRLSLPSSMMRTRTPLPHPLEPRAHGRFHVGRPHSAAPGTFLTFTRR